MTDITPQRLLIQIEETRSKAAVSESTMTRMGAMNNFLALKECSQHDMNLNNAYNIIATPNLAIDGFLTFPFNFEIVEAYIFSGSSTGSGGTTNLDVKWKPQASGSYASIFSTTPKFAGGTAPAFGSANTTFADTGFTSPVLSKTQFNANDILRFDLLGAATGDVNGAYLKLFIRPR